MSFSQTSWTKEGKPSLSIETTYRVFDRFGNVSQANLSHASGVSPLKGGKVAVQRPVIGNVL